MMATAPRPLIRRFAFLCLWLFIFSMPIEKAIEIPGLGSISKLLGFVSLGVGLLAIVMQEGFRIPGQIQTILAIFVLWSSFTLRWSISPDWTVERILTYVQLLSLVFLLWEFCTEDRDVLSLLSAYVLGTLIPAGDTVQRFLLGHNTYYNRYATTGFDPNDLALTLALSLPMSYYLTLRSKGPICWVLPGTDGGGDRRDVSDGLTRRNVLHGDRPEPDCVDAAVCFDAPTDWNRRGWCFHGGRRNCTSASDVLEAAGIGGRRSEPGHAEQPHGFVEGGAR